jgi:nanoRNase/pAp phosphatase (c-di-AMP/oligoRNAs hydrolase)
MLPHKLNMLDKIINELRSGKKLVLVHSNADPDAVGSAYALAQAFQDLAIGVYEGVNKSSKKLINKLKADVVVNPNLELLTHQRPCFLETLQKT